jgi:hypothetical protein
MFMEPSPQIPPLLGMDVEEIGTLRCLGSEYLEHIEGLILLIDGAATMFEEERLYSLNDLRSNFHIFWKSGGRIAICSRPCRIGLIIELSLRPESIQLIEQFRRACFHRLLDTVILLNHSADVPASVANLIAAPRKVGACHQLSRLHIGRVQRRYLLLEPFGDAYLIRSHAQPNLINKNTKRHRRAVKAPRMKVLEGAAVSESTDLRLIAITGSRYAWLDRFRETLDPYRDCPEKRSVGCTGRAVGAVSIGSFELSRWRLRRTRWAMGFQSIRTGCRACLKPATETKRDKALFLNIALES